MRSGADSYNRDQQKREPVGFDALPGWGLDDHEAALSAYRLSQCREPGRLPPVSGRDARAFFETNFRPHHIVSDGQGLVTGYFEPVVAASRTPTPEFPAPLYTRPPDLVELVTSKYRGTRNGELTHARHTSDGLVPYWNRAEIDAGALTGRGLELAYLRDPVDVFAIQIQGSGRLRLPDGVHMRVTYDGKNGLPYTSVGQHLIASGAMRADDMTWQAMEAWLKADLARARHAMQVNRSYVFFKELTGDDGAAPRGVLDLPLVPGRSMAVDASFHDLGLPIYVSAPDLTHDPELTHDIAGNGFHRLMVAHDVGSAIKGPTRGDIYFGSGHDAGLLAGQTKHAADFFVLLPNTQSGSSR